MNDTQFNIIKNALEEINKNIALSHNQHLNLIQKINTRQIRLEKILGFGYDEDPFIPWYHPRLAINTAYPDIFNKYGEKMEVFFISDRDFAHVPNSKNSRYIIWDRYNYALKTHFYTHDEIFRTVGKPEKKFGVLMEPRVIKPECYQNIIQHKDYIEKSFDAIFTFDAQLLSTLKNAKFAPMAAEVWYGKNMEGIMIRGIKAGFSGDGGNKDEVIIFEDNYKRKTKNISMIASNKNACEGHIRRQKLAFKVKNEKLADTFGQFDGGGYCPIELPFEEYRYSIAVENSVEPFYFTEKILNCFMAQTIPIYLGATEIGRFFNPNGIIQISIADCDHIEDILAKCTPEEYERRLPAVLDNFKRVKTYADHTRFDDIYLNYLKK